MSPAPNNSAIGLLAGLLLAVAGVIGGLGAFLAALVIGAIGFGIGRWIDGGPDVDELSERLSGLTGRGTVTVIFCKPDRMRRFSRKIGAPAFSFPAAAP